MTSRDLLIGIGLLFVAGAAQAQAPAPAMDGTTRVGIGVNLAPAALVLSGSGQSSYMPVGLGNLFFPILIGRSFKLEAEAGILKMSSDASGTGYSASSKSSSFRFGVGAFSVKQLGGGATLLYVGPRIGLIATSSKTTTSYQGGGSETGVDETDWLFGLAVGGEHFLSRHFSLGGELQLNYLSYGTPNVTGSSGSQPTSDRSLISTNGLLLLRAYF